MVCKKNDDIRVQKQQIMKAFFEITRVSHIKMVVRYHQLSVQGIFRVDGAELHITINYSRR